MTLEQLQDFYQQRARRLAALSLADILAELDEAWLVENGSIVLTPKSLESFMLHCLRREERQSPAQINRDLLEALRDERVVAQRIQYKVAFAHANNRLSREFLTQFADDGGWIIWEKLLAYISGKAE